MTKSLLVVEDEPAMRQLVSDAVATAGFTVVEATTAAVAEQLAHDTHPAAILLDLGLPDADGMALLRRLRSWCTAPVIVLSGRHCEDDKIAALDAGADDYLTKPFSTGELLARIRVALRHALEATYATGPILTVGPLRIDQARREVTFDGTLVHLTPIEFKLLALLARHAGQVLTHGQLLQEIYGPSNVHQTHHLRVHMAALRRKIEPHALWPRWLTTEAGVGYRLRDS